jgi:hypothetical protein
MSTPPAALTIRPATADDAMALADIVNNMIKIGGTMAHITPFKAERLRDRYITPPLGISCGVAERNSQVLGFQALEWADQNWQGAGKLPSGWAIIATFVVACHSCQGIGAALFCATRLAAQNAGVTSIDATICADNCGGLLYYADIAFTEDQRISAMVLPNGCYVDRICTAFALQTPCLKHLPAQG